MYTKYGSNKKGLIVIGVTGEPRDNDAVVKQYKIDNNVLYPEVSSPANQGNAVKVANDYRVSLFPTMFLIAPTKKVVEKDIYPATKLTTILAKYNIDTNTVAVKDPHVKAKAEQTTMLRVISKAGAPVINLSVFHDGFYRIDAYTMSGKLIVNVLNSNLSRGTHQISWTNQKVFSGTVLFKITRPDKIIETKTVISW
jgi:hypothetical protein